MQRPEFLVVFRIISEYNEYDWSVNKMTRTVKREITEQSKKTIPYFDYSLVAILICLVCFGLVMLYSTSAYSSMKITGQKSSIFYLKKQIIFCLAGFFVMWFICRFIDYHWYIKRAKLLYWVSIILMALVQSPIGKGAKGAKRWIMLPGIGQFQPSEVAKIAVILFIPVVICKLGKKINTKEGFIHVMVWGLLSAACVYFLTDNLSTAIIVMGISIIMIFIVHRKTKIFFVAAGGGLAAILVGVKILGMVLTTSKSFRMRRVLVWLNPENYASEGGYQIMQALYAIGSGGFFGKGLGNSAQKTIIPEVQNDMILSIICEELGVFGAILVLTLFGLLLYRLLFIAQNAPDLYGSLIVTGIFAHMALQVFLNVGVVTNLIPTTGITLPFISYGGTAILFLSIEMGIALSVSKQIKIEQ